MLLACSSSPPLGAPQCPSTTQQPLVNGVTQETYLGLAQPQISAVVQIADATQPSGPLCSGAFVAPGWVVTAKHCLAIQFLQIIVQGSAKTPVAALPVIASVPHPTEDVALLQVDVSAADAGTVDAGSLVGVAPLQAGGASVALLAVGDVVEMAGYGLTETRSVRSLRFLTESIVGINSTTITVRGFGASGACEGDSGSPLLIRASDGAPVVAGVLSMGSATCRDEDSYVRLDGIQDWVTSLVGSYTPVHNGCGTITPEGRCLYGSAIWCSGTELTADSCTVPKRCGWDRSQAGFRCLDAMADPCGGVDSVGACVRGEASRCRGGALDRRPCAPCGACRIDGKTGSPACVPGSPAVDGGGP